ncbi:hypothetical protein EVJ58_g1460 [Rhodofomes roseus]|uniref:NAD-dependent epimerase/dehydratase domain-containing protein n=1 Tax=Rhodofomes roseus TaxID=34475 RepID=A0A4Y9Z2V8_9APHY|nr:hypothetical protein EVJ58_g1460 [Rhodofomes roseus]
MPAVAAGRVLVTGVNGYIGLWVARVLLERGYTVRGTVRSEGKAKHIRQLFKPFGEKFEMVIVPDITKVGAFDEAVKDMDAVEHTASPYHFKAGDPDELIVPALHGTTRVLESILAHGSSVKRVVVTSSVAAVLQVQSTPRVFTEEDWNDASVVEVREKGAGASQAGKYRASKTLAERAAWDFVEKNRGSIGWDLVVLNPPMVFGPAIHEVGAPEALNESMHNWFHSVFRGSQDPKQLGTLGMAWVDVRDLADAHALAIEQEEAGGNRIIIASGPYKWQDWINAARTVDASAPPGDQSYDPAKAVHMLMFDASKSAKLLGLKYRSIQETTSDIVGDFKARGWL